MRKLKKFNNPKGIMSSANAGLNGMKNTTRTYPGGGGAGRTAKKTGGVARANKKRCLLPLMRLSKLFVGAILTVAAMAAGGGMTAMADHGNKYMYDSIEYAINYSKQGENDCWYEGRFNKDNKGTVGISVIRKRKVNKSGLDTVILYLPSTEIKGFTIKSVWHGQNTSTTVSEEGDTLLIITFSGNGVSTNTTTSLFKGEGTLLRPASTLQQYKVWAALGHPDNAGDTISAKTGSIIIAEKPQVVASMQPEIDSTDRKEEYAKINIIFSGSNEGKAIAIENAKITVIVAKDSAGRKFDFDSSYTTTTSLADYKALYDKGISKSDSYRIGWREAEFDGGTYASLKSANIPTSNSKKKVFKALHRDSLYVYAYYYTSSDGCELDTTLFMAVWVEKNYAPKLTHSSRGNDSVTRMDYNPATCTGLYAIKGLPYVKDVAEDVNTSDIDTIQIDTVKRFTIVKGEATDSAKLIYNGAWSKSTLMDTMSLKDGAQYKIVYEFRFKYAPRDSVASDTIYINAPYSIATHSDTDTAKTSSPKSIFVLENDTVSQCLINANGFYLVVDTLGAGQPPGYDTIGRSTRGGKVAVKVDETKSGYREKYYVEYTSPPDFQGFDTFFYQIQDTSEVGRKVGNVKTDTVVVRVEPVYGFTVEKTVDSVLSRKSKRYAGSSPNLDSVLVGDTVYFTVKVTNSGKNSIMDSAIIVADTFPAAMGLPNSFGTTLTPTEIKNAGGPLLGYKWEYALSSPADTLRVDSSFTLAYYLIARDTATAPPDANRVHVEVTLPKNSFDPPPNDTAITADTILTIRVFESIDVALTQDVLMLDGSGFTPPQNDTLRCDSLFQPVQLVMTATNVGSTPLSSIKISSRIKVGLTLDSAHLLVVDKNSSTPLNSDFLSNAQKSSGSDKDTTYMWSLDLSSGYAISQIGADSALRVVVYATVNRVDTSYIKSWVEVGGKADIDSTDNRDSVTVIFWPEIKLEVKMWTTNHSTNASCTPTPTSKCSYGQGGDVRYSIAIANHSALPLRGVEVKDTLLKTYLKPDTTLNTNSSLNGPSRAQQLTWTTDSTLLWKIPHLAGGGADTLHFLVKAQARTDTGFFAKNGGDSTVSNIAYATIPLYSKDSIYKNDSCKIMITSGLDLEVKAYVTPPEKRQGDTVTLTVVVKNISTNSEEVDDNVKVQITFHTDSLKEERYATASGSKSSYSSQSKIWAIHKDMLKSNGDSDSIALTLRAIYTGRVRLGGYITNISYQPRHNDTDVVTLHIVENVNDLTVKKKVSEKAYLSYSKAQIADTIILSTYKASIGGITLVDTLPPYVSSAQSIAVASASSSFPSGYSIDSSTNRYILKWTAISLPASEVDTIVVSYVVNTLGVHKSAAYAFCDSVEATLVNNADHGSTNVRSKVDLKVVERKPTTKHPMLPYLADPATQVAEGDTIIYTLVFEHNLPDSEGDATGVTLAFDPVDDSTIFLSARYFKDNNRKPTIDASGRRITFDSITILNKDADSVEVRVRVKPNASKGSDSIRYKAYLSCSDDVIPNNDTIRGALKAIKNPYNLSVSIKPGDTYFLLSAASGMAVTPKFADTIIIKNLRDTEISDNVHVSYPIPKGISYQSVYPGPSYTDDGINTLAEWNFSAIPQGKDTMIRFEERTLPYDKVASYESKISAWFTTGQLDADPDNNTAKVTASVIYDVNLKIDSIWLYSEKTGGNAYRQGDTIAVRVKLTNMKGIKVGYNVTTTGLNANGFTLVSANAHLPDTLAKNGARYDTLKFVIDTFTTGNDSLCFHVVASADTSQTSPTFRVTDSLQSPKFAVRKGADAKVWVDTVMHNPSYYSNLSYTIAVTNDGQYRASGVALHHVLQGRVPGGGGTVDSVRARLPDGTTSRLDSAAGEWPLGDLQAQNSDTVRVTLYVTANSSPDTLSITGHITCANDDKAGNDTIREIAKEDSARLVMKRNPYHLTLTKTSKYSANHIRDTITYYIVLANEGDSAAYNVHVVDTIRNGVKFDTAYGGSASERDTVKYYYEYTYDNITNSIADSVFLGVFWKVDTIAPNTKDTLIIKALPREAGRVVNNVHVVHVDSTISHPFDPDAKNRRGYTAVSATDIYSDQQIAVTLTTAKPSGEPADANTFTQGDTVMFTITVAKDNPNEKALGIKIHPYPDVSGKLEFCLPPPPPPYGNFTIADTCWTFDFQESENSATLKLYAIVGPKSPAGKDDGLDVVTLLLDVYSTDNHYPKISGKKVASSPINLEYNDLDLKVVVKVESTQRPNHNQRAIYEGETFAYYIYVYNMRGALSPTDVVTLTDTLPYGNVTPQKINLSYDDADSVNDGRMTLCWRNLTPFLGNIKEGEAKLLMLAECSGGAIGDYLINKAQIAVNRREADLSNNSSADTVFVIDAVDLELTAAFKSDTVVQGHELELEVTVTNRSQRPLSDLSVTSKIPQGLRFIGSSSGSDYMKYGDDSVFTWRNSSGYLASGESRTITLTVQAVDTGAVECWVTLRADNKDNRSTDTATLYVAKNPYNVALTKSASPSVFYVEDYRPSGSKQWPPSVTYTIAVKNTGDNALHGVVVRDTLPAGIDTTSVGFPSSGVAVEPLGDGRAAVTFSAIPSLGVQQSSAFTIPCRFDTAIMVGSYRQYLNRACASCNEKEASTADNADTALVEMRRKLSLKVEVALCPPNTDENSVKPYASSHEFRQGDTLEIWVSVTNVGKEAFLDPASVNLQYNDVTSWFSSVQGFSSIYNTMPFVVNTPRRVHSVVRAEKAEEFSIRAIATVSSTGGSNPDFSISDSSAVTGSILPGADMRVEVKVPPSKTDYDVKRAYTISMGNIGKFRAGGVTLRHTLDTLLESVDTIIFVRSFGSEKRYPVGSSDLDIPLSEGRTEAIRYESATRSISYSIDNMYVNDNVFVTLLVTTVPPRAEETLEIWPEASVEVASNIDYYLGNNRTRSNTPIIVQPNPYNVSISILPNPPPLPSASTLTPKELRTTEMRNISEGTVSQAYAIKAKNIGRFPADSVEVFFEAGAGLKISEGATNPAATVDGKIVRWSFEQLIPKDSSSFSVTVEAENLSAKGQQVNPVKISVGNGFDDGYPRNNEDTAYLNLFPVLSSWPIMEAFSPNNDHKNDVFKIPDLRSDVVERAELVIVNRYGSEVYSHSNYKNVQDDESAAFTGAGLPEGSYFYLLTIHFADKTVDKRGGAIAIRRSRWK
jgi:gliding motility-associated-like protein/uncharacterized repeat protein (TIGR01451 family)